MLLTSLVSKQHNLRGPESLEPKYILKMWSFLWTWFSNPRIKKHNYTHQCQRVSSATSERSSRSNSKSQQQHQTQNHLKCLNLSVRERSTTTAYTEINSLHDLKWPDPPFLVEKLQWGTSLMSEQLEDKTLYIKSISLFKHTQHKYTHFRTFTNLQFTSDWRVKGQTNQATSLIFNKPAQVCQIKWSGLLTHAGLESGLPPKKNIKTARFIKLDSLRLTATWSRAVHDRKFFREPRSGTWLQSINTAPLVSLCEKLTKGHE